CLFSTHDADYNHPHPSAGLPRCSICRHRPPERKHVPSVAVKLASTRTRCSHLPQDPRTSLAGPAYYMRVLNRPAVAIDCVSSRGTPSRAFAASRQPNIILQFTSCVLPVASNVLPVASINLV
ncbi:hypothetical protein OE88DRAFT_1656331, partial [Heliocybe sulcata]